VIGSIKLSGKLGNVIHPLVDNTHPTVLQSADDTHPSSTSYSCSITINLTIVFADATGLAINFHKSDFIISHIPEGHSNQNGIDVRLQASPILLSALPPTHLTYIFPVGVPSFSFLVEYNCMKQTTNGFT
jgi:hypothetical protein